MSLQSSKFKESKVVACSLLFWCSTILTPVHLREEQIRLKQSKIQVEAELALLLYSDSVLEQSSS